MRELPYATVLPLVSQKPPNLEISPFQPFFYLVKIDKEFQLNMNLFQFKKEKECFTFIGSSDIGSVVLTDSKSIWIASRLYCEHLRMIMIAIRAMTMPATIVQSNWISFGVGAQISSIQIEAIGWKANPYFTRSPCQFGLVIVGRKYWCTFFSF